MKNITKGLMAGIISSVPMSLYHQFSKAKESDEDEVLSTTSSLSHGALYGAALWASGLLALNQGFIFKKKTLYTLPAYLVWGVALGYAENKLRAHQQRQIHALN